MVAMIEALIGVFSCYGTVLWTDQASAVCLPLPDMIQGGFRNCSDYHPDMMPKYILLN